MTRSHGTRSCYSDGCRCNQCRDTETNYQRHRRRKIAQGDNNGNTILPEPLGPWAQHGLCIYADPDIFFPPKGDVKANRAAKAICARCPVITDCAAHAIPNEQFGIWGGMSERERRNVRHNQQEAA